MFWVTIAFIFQNAGNSTISQAISTQPSITIVSLVWWPGCQPASAIKRLNSTQKLASFGIMWVTHTATSFMEALTCRPPLDLEVQGKVRWTLTLESGVLVLPQPPSRTHVPWTHIRRVDPISNVQDHTMVLQKFSTTYYENITYSTEMIKTFIFNILSFKRPTWECDVKVRDM